MRQSHPFLDRRGPIAFAHRGGSLEAEENTMPAFERAVALGYGHVELDVHLTKDGEVVVHHDASLARVFGVDRLVSDLTMADLAGITSKGGATVPRFADVLSSFPDLKINIEAKSDEVVEPLAEVIRHADALDRIGIGSFSASRTARARALLGPDLIWSPAHGGVARMVAAGYGLPFRPEFRCIQVPVRWKGIPVVTPKFVRAAHQAGVQVHVWTVDDEAEMINLLDMGVDGLMTDRPTLLREVLIRRGEWD